MSFKPVDRLPAIEWAGWWNLTIERWRKEGLPGHLADAGAIREHLGLDCCRQIWIAPRAATAPSPASHGAALIENEEDYRRVKAHLYPAPGFDHALPADWAPCQKDGQMVIWFTLEGFFWFPRTLFGIEGHLYAFSDQPELMHRINEDLLAFNLRVLDELCRICQPSFMTFAEDMSYNHGPMLSKQYFDEFLAPYYCRIVPAIKERGIIPLVDSDGDVTMLIPWLESVGIEGLLPLERMAGVDVARIRRDHPRFKMIGAFDKTIMHLGEDAMRREFERLLPVMKTGGFIPSVDHQTPPDVSLDQYRLYVSLLKEYCAKAGV
ncbi:MAG: uroporphyrinogen decarboxylase family protein [Verrucomicrobiae bacterium]|nr:uroporphyrinogen decarboxylase family protein [Verrucomicrobiae bacterium]